MTTLLVASTGGHLSELAHLAPRLSPHAGDAVWVTNDTAQSRSVLRGERVVFVPYAGSRNVPVTAHNLLRARRVLRTHQPDQVISTGSGIALSFLLPATALGVPCHYIESGTRVLGPSLTGRLLEPLPGVRCYTQHSRWASRNWCYRGSVLDGFAAEHHAAPARLDRVVVALGSWQQSFRRLVERLVEILPASSRTTWQTGHTDVRGLVDAPHPWLSAEQLQRALHDADLVITHAGMGSSLDALAAGKLPVVVPRLAAHGEQVDDHQVELGTELHRLGLAVVRSPESLTLDDLLVASRGRVVRAGVLHAFALDS